MEQERVSPIGFYCALALCIVGTVGQALTTERLCNDYDWLWIGVFALAIIVLSGALVNFDPKRWLR